MYKCNNRRNAPCWKRHQTCIWLADKLKGVGVWACVTYCKLAYSLNVLSHKVTKRFLLTSQVSWPHWFLFSIFSANILRNPQFFRGLSFLGIKCHSFIIRHTLMSSRQSSSIPTMNSALSNLLGDSTAHESLFLFHLCIRSSQSTRVKIQHLRNIYGSEMLFLLKPYLLQSHELHQLFLNVILSLIIGAIIVKDILPTRNKFF